MLGLLRFAFVRWKVVVLRTLLPVHIVILMLTGAACTKPSYGERKVDDASSNNVGGPRADVDGGSAGPLGAPGLAKPPQNEGGKDTGVTAVSPQPDAATQTACIVGVSRIGECKLH
jgi:hypothetical protein